MFAPKRGKTTTFQEIIQNFLCQPTHQNCIYPPQKTQSIVELVTRVYIIQLNISYFFFPPPYKCYGNRFSPFRHRLHPVLPFSELLTVRGICAIFSFVKGCEEDTRPGKATQRGAVW